MQLNARNNGAGLVGRNGIKRKQQLAQHSGKTHAEAEAVSKSVNSNPFKTVVPEEMSRNAIASNAAVNRSYCYESHNNSIQNNGLHSGIPMSNNLVSNFMNQSYEYPNNP